MRHFSQALSMLLIFISASLITYAQTIYVWEDSQGRKHYTQLKPSEHMQSGIKHRNAPESHIPEQYLDEQFEAKQPTKAFLIDNEQAIQHLQNEKKRAELAKQRQENEQEKEARLAKEKEEKEALSTIAKEEQRRAANCEVAKSNLETITQYLQGEYSDLKYEDEEGNEISLSQDQIKKIHESSQEEVEYFCN